MRSFSNIATFIQVAQAQSFAEGAARIGISTSAASKAVQRLEEEIGVKLFHRTTRSVTLTVEGERFLEGARRLIDEVEALTAEVSDSLETPRGRLVVSAPAVFGRLVLTERVVEFMARYPQVEVELNFEDRNIDLASENVDVAVRIGALDDSANLVARKLYDDTLYTCASPEYLARQGTPKSISDLENHRCMHYRVRTTGRFFPYMFHADGEVVKQTFQPVLVANSVDALCQASISGLGLAQLPSFLALPAIERGDLVEVLGEHRHQLRYSLIYLDRRLVSPRVRAFVDFLVGDVHSFSPGP